MHTSLASHTELNWAALAEPVQKETIATAAAPMVAVRRARETAVFIYRSMGTEIACLGKQAYACRHVKVHQDMQKQSCIAAGYSVSAADRRASPGC
jgi:hypothetical protein